VASIVRSRVLTRWCARRAAQHGMKLAGDTIDRFSYTMDEIQLMQRIGSGSYGEVYKGSVRGQIVAVKKLHVRNLKAEQVDAFCKEASLMWCVARISAVRACRR
jgi:hypothetical protein